MGGPSSSACPMEIYTNQLRYTATAIGFHWLLALMITASLAFGLYTVDLPFSPARVRQYNWHKWAGITILALSTARLLWRIGHRPPDLPTHMPAWQQRTFHAAHLMLYFLFHGAPFGRLGVQFGSGLSGRLLRVLAITRLGTAQCRAGHHSEAGSPNADFQSRSAGWAACVGCF